MTCDTEKTIPTEEKTIHRKPYHSPTLSDFGTITLLTQTNNMSVDLDGVGTMMGSGAMAAS